MRAPAPAPRLERRRPAPRQRRATTAPSTIRAGDACRSLLDGKVASAVDQAQRVLCRPAGLSIVTTFHHAAHPQPVAMFRPAHTAAILADPTVPTKLCNLRCSTVWTWSRVT